jgi:hypothetical protein
MEMQDEDRGVRRDGIDLIECREPFLRELTLGKTADDPIEAQACGRLPLSAGAWRQRRAHAVPPTGPGSRAGRSGRCAELTRRRAHHLVVVSDGSETSVSNRKGRCGRRLPIERGSLAVEHDNVYGTFHRLGLRVVPLRARHHLCVCELSVR